MFDLTIQPEREGKGRTFRGTLLAYATANTLWSNGTGGSDKTIRPVFAMVAASEGEIRPLLANLRQGRKATLGELQGRSRSRQEEVEFLRSANYSVVTQRHPEGTVATFYLQQLFLIDPGMVDPERISFVLLPLASTVTPDPKIEDHLGGLGLLTDENRPVLPQLQRLAPLFALFLDRRTRAPLLTEPLFHVQLLFACLASGLASLSCPDGYYGYHSQEFGRTRGLGFCEVGTEDVGLAPGVAMCATHENFEKLLAEQVTLFYGRK